MLSAGNLCRARFVLYGCKKQFHTITLRRAFADCGPGIPQVQKGVLETPILDQARILLQKIRGSPGERLHDSLNFRLQREPGPGKLSASDLPFGEAQIGLRHKRRHKNRFGLSGSGPNPFILLVGAGRFERPTPCAQGRCATRLRYAPTVAGTENPPPALRRCTGEHDSPGATEADSVPTLSIVALSSGPLAEFDSAG